MSLQVWLPLNGNLTNQGLCGTATITGGNTFTATGKCCAKAYNTSTELSITVSSMSGKKVWSYCFWGYVVSSSITSDWTGIARLNDGSSNLRIEVCPSANYNGIYCYSTHNNSGYAITNGSIASPTGGYYDKWAHFCLTCDGTTITKYMNGTAIGTSSYTGTGAITGVFVLVNSDKIYKQDVRIYDHCLSPKEVKEISKGLVLHYPLNNQFTTSMVNKYSGEYAIGYMSGSYTRTKLTNERGYNYTYSYTGTGSNSWSSMCCPNFSFTAGKKYYYSCSVRVHSSNFAIYLRASRSNNDWVTNMVTIVSSSLADNKWHRYVVSQTVNSTYDRSGSTVTCNPVLEFYSQSCATSGTVYSCNFDVKDIMVVEATEDIPYIDNSMSSTTVSDVSGFGNNGTISGSLTWTASTSRYNGCYSFPNGTDYIKSAFALSMPQISCSFWVCPNSSNGGYSILTSNYSSPSSGFWIATNCESAGMWFYNGGYAKSGSITSLTNGTWYHGCFVFDNGIAKWYVNGSLVSTTDISSKGTSLSLSNICVGNSYTGSTWNTKRYGNISDFRIYCTALSASDVLELYNTGISIDNGQNTFAYELMEE